jgi:hypothetical protein
VKYSKRTISLWSLPGFREILDLLLLDDKPPTNFKGHITGLSDKPPALLNTETLALEEFIGNNIPPYAILSHRWEAKEITFQDLHFARGVTGALGTKINGCCSQALSDGWKYVVSTPFGVL